MPNFAHVTLIGHLGKDAETKFTPSGKAITKFSLAVNTGSKDNKVTSWYNVDLWDKEALAQYLTKGKAVLVSGEIKIREYEKNDGSKGISVDVTGREIQLLGDGGHETQAVSKPRSAQRPAPPIDSGITDDDVPF